MENTIDRKAYRRNVYNNYERKEKVEVKRSNNLFLNKIINSMLLLLFVLLLKFFYFEEEFEFIKEEFNCGYSFEYIKEVLNEKINGLSLLNEEKEETSSGDNIFIESIPSVSGESEYIEAVEGVNQLMDDSAKIKTNYALQPPLKGVITSEFGCRESDNPIISSYHNGLDIAANTGAIITSAHSGKVIQAGDNGTYGKCVTIESGDLITVYAHCNEVLVKKGENVNKGQSIAKVGMTGNATGPHLHFEVKLEGRVVNPKDVIEFGDIW